MFEKEHGFNGFDGWGRIYYGLIKNTVDLYLKFNLNPKEKITRLNQLNPLNLRSFLTYLPYNHLSHHIFLQFLINSLNNGVF